MSQVQLAKLVHLTRPYVSMMETGRRVPSPDVAKLLDRVLSTGSVLYDIVSASGDTPEHALQIGHDIMRRREFTGAAIGMVVNPLGSATQGTHSMGRQVGVSDLSALRGYLTALTAADEKFGGRHGIGTVAGLVSGDIQSMCRAGFGSSTVRAEMFRIAAEATYLLAWKLHDIGDEASATSCWRSAITLAGESGDRGHEAWLYRILALQGSDTGNPRDIVANAQMAADKAKGLGGRLEALMHTANARVLAESGDYKAARVSLNAAGRWMGHEPDSETPTYASAWCPHNGNVMVQAGHAHAAMWNWPDAIDCFRSARDLWDRSEHARVWGMDSYLVGEAQYQSGDHGAAEDTWREAIAVLRSVASDRTREREEKIYGFMPHLREAV